MSKPRRNRKRERERWVGENPLRVAILAKGRRLWGAMRAAAVEIGVSRESLHAWCSGKSAPTLTHLDRFDTLYGVTPDAYLNWWRRKP